MKYPNQTHKFRLAVNIVFGFIMIFLLADCSSSRKGEGYYYDKLIDRTKYDLNQYDTSVISERARDFFISGTVLQQQFRHAEAILDFQQALKLDSSAVIYFAIARSYKEIEKYGLSIENAAKALKINPEFIPAIELLVDVFLIQDNYDEALTNLERLVEIDPSRDRKFALARFYEYSQTDKAIALYEELAAQAEDVNVLRRLANLYNKKGNNEKYLQTLERIFILSPNDSKVAADIISEYSISGDYKKAFGFLDKIEMKLPNDDLAHCYVTIAGSLLDDSTNNDDEYIRNLIDRIDQRFYLNWRIHLMGAYLADKVKDTVRRNELFDHTLKVYDSIPEIPIQIGFFYYRNKNYDKGISIINENAKYFPTDYRFPFYAGIGMISMKKYDSALTYTLLSLKLDSGNVEIYSQLGYLYDQMKNHAKSDSSYEKALRLDPDNLSANNNYSYSLATRGRQLDRSLEMITKVIKTDSTNAAYLDTYGWINYIMGNYNEAMEYLLKASESLDASAEVFEHLGDIYNKLGKRKKAVKAWEKAIQLEPDNKSVQKKLNLIK